MLRPGERRRDGLHVARFVLERKVAGHVGVQLRRAGGHRRLEACDGGQVAVLDLDQLPRILGNRRGIRDDHRHRLADEAHAVEREHRVVRLAQLLPVPAGVADDVRQRLESGCARAVAGQHRSHAGMSQRPRGVDAGDIGMRPVGAEKSGVQLARQVPVGRVAALAGDETGVFPAGSSLRDEG